MIDIPIPKVEGFVIYNPDEGLFSSGGARPCWRKKPKIWANIGHLKNHLHGAIDRSWYSGYDSRKYVIMSPFYKGAVVLDITTGKSIDLNIYQWFEEATIKSGRAGTRQFIFMD